MFMACSVLWLRLTESRQSCLSALGFQANTLYFLSELNCEGPFLLFLVFIPITLPGIYDPLGSVLSLTSAVNVDFLIVML